jgi:hypothetical protein
MAAFPPSLGRDDEAPCQRADVRASSRTFRAALAAPLRTLLANPRPLLARATSARAP